MEQNPSVLPKKVWNLVRVVYFLLRKSISKRKLLLEINMMIKRGKIAGKAIFHHHHNREDFTTNHLSFTSPQAAGEYEFSCSNSPSSITNKHHPFSLFSHHKKHHHESNRNLPSKDHLDMMAVEAVLKAMEMIHTDNSSPALPGFGSTPVVRQLRVTDSPFPLNNNNVDENNHVDEKAEQFISRFYNDLRRQNTTAYRI